MRILFVLPRMVSGGVERVTLHLIGHFESEGDACMLALGQCRGELLDEARALVDVHDLASDGFRHFLPRLARLIREWRPTHIVTAFADIGLLAQLARRFAGSDAILVHGVHDTHGRESARPGWRGRVRHRAYQAMAAVACRHADLVVAVSVGVGREVRSGHGVPADRIRVIYNPVMPDTWMPVVANGPAPSVGVARIVALGRLARQKGFDVLVRAMELVPDDPPWTLDIHGEGPERPALEGLIARSGLGDRIRLRGHANDPFGTLGSADLFVLPSRHEGLGNVLIEAMACGVQVVASDCRHGPREILEDGGLGQLVPPEDPPALAAAITRVLAGGERCEPGRLVARARHFTIGASCTRWREALLDLSSQQGRG